MASLHDKKIEMKDLEIIEINKKKKKKKKKNKIKSPTLVGLLDGSGSMNTDPRIYSHKCVLAVLNKIGNDWGSTSVAALFTKRNNELDLNILSSNLSRFNLDSVQNNEKKRINIYNRYQKGEIDWNQCQILESQIESSKFKFNGGTISMIDEILIDIPDGRIILVLTTDGQVHFENARFLNEKRNGETAIENMCSKISILDHSILSRIEMIFIVTPSDIDYNLRGQLQNAFARITSVIPGLNVRLISCGIYNVENQIETIIKESINIKFNIPPPPKGFYNIPIDDEKYVCISITITAKELSNLLYSNFNARKAIFNWVINRVDGVLDGLSVMTALVEDKVWSLFWKSLHIIAGNFEDMKLIASVLSDKVAELYKSENCTELQKRQLRDEIAKRSINTEKIKRMCNSIILKSDKIIYLGLKSLNKNLTDALQMRYNLTRYQVSEILCDLDIAKDGLPIGFDEDGNPVKPRISLQLIPILFGHNFSLPPEMLLVIMGTIVNASTEYNLKIRNLLVKVVRGTFVDCNDFLIFVEKLFTPVIDGHRDYKQDVNIGLLHMIDILCIFFGGKIPEKYHKVLVINALHNAIHKFDRVNVQYKVEREFRTVVVKATNIRKFFPNLDKNNCVTQKIWYDVIFDKIAFDSQTWNCYRNFYHSVGNVLGPNGYGPQTPKWILNNYCCLNTLMSIGKIVIEKRIITEKRSVSLIDVFEKIMKADDDIFNEINIPSWIFEIMLSGNRMSSIILRQIADANFDFRNMLNPSRKFIAYILSMKFRFGKHDAYLDQFDILKILNTLRSEFLKIFTKKNLYGVQEIGFTCLSCLSFSLNIEKIKICKNEHFMCYNCSSKWISSKKINGKFCNIATCPICREPIIDGCDDQYEQFIMVICKYYHVNNKIINKIQALKMIATDKNYLCPCTIDNCQNITVQAKGGCNGREGPLTHPGPILCQVHSGIKNCPNCNIKIEKNGGCDHLECIKCQTHFCWGCLKEFNDIYDHLNYNYRCPDIEI